MSNDAYAWIALGISAMALLNLGALFYSAYWKLPLAEQRLANSRIISDTKSIWRGNDPIARFNRLVAVATVFTLSSVLDKRGLIDRKEANHVPLGLRMWTAGPIVGSCLVSIAAVSVWLMG